MKSKSRLDIFRAMAMILTLLLLFSMGPYTVSGQSQKQEPPPSGIVAYVLIKLVNDQEVPIENGTQVLISVDWHHYKSYLARNLMNVEFLNSSWVPLYAWIEDNATSLSSESRVWVRIGVGGIGANSDTTIYLAFLNASTNNFSPYGYWGEAPELSPQYAEYDNGALVFDYYSNFSGYTLPAGWTSTYMDYAVVNGITAQSVGNGIAGSLEYSGAFNPEAEVMDVNAYFNGLSGGSGTQIAGWNDNQNNRVVLGLSDAGNGSQYSLLSSRSGVYGTGLHFKSIPNGSLSNYQVWSVGAVGNSYAYLDLNYNKQISISPYYTSTVSFPYIFSSTTNHFIFIQWIRVRTSPPNAVMPSATFGYVQRPSYVIFSESGLPSGTLWSVTLNGDSQSSTSRVIEFPVSNGSYLYRIQNVSGFQASPSYENIEVRGSNVSITVAFLRLYEISVVESGLPPGTVWNVTLNGQNFTSYNSSIDFQLTNGTYTYSVQSVEGFNCTSPNGTFVVSGEGRSVNLNFVLMVPFTFIELGLPSRAHWSVYIGGKFYNSSSSFISIYLPNGSYTYVVILPSGYETSAPAGRVDWNNTVVIVNANSPIRNAVEISVLIAMLALITIYFVRKSRKAESRRFHKKQEEKQKLEEERMGEERK